MLFPKKIRNATEKNLATKRSLESNVVFGRK